MDWCTKCNRWRDLKNLDPRYAERRPICIPCHRSLVYAWDICPECPPPRNRRAKLLHCPHPDSIQRALGIHICTYCFLRLVSEIGICPICESKKLLAGPHPELGYAVRICFRCYGRFRRGDCSESPPAKKQIQPPPYNHPHYERKGAGCLPRYRRIRGIGICARCVVDQK